MKKISDGTHMIYFVTSYATTMVAFGALLNFGIIIDYLNPIILYFGVFVISAVAYFLPAFVTFNRAWHIVAFIIWIVYYLFAFLQFGFSYPWVVAIALAGIPCVIGLFKRIFDVGDYDK